MKITRLKRIDKESLKDINALLAQLRGEPFDTKATLAQASGILLDKNIVCMVIQDGSKIVGMATLYTFQKFGKRVGHVEDVVVDSAYRGQGLGEKIMLAVIDAARTKKMTSIDLTSNPARIAANKLYQKIGFEHYETNVYRMKF